MNFPWVDIELLDARNIRDKLYKIHAATNTEFDYQIFSSARANYNLLLNEKMITYFKNKSTKDFKNSKKFWQFYSATVKLKSFGINQSMATTISNGEETFDDPEKISNLFTIHFTSLASESNKKHDQSHEFIKKNFDQIIKEKENNNELLWQMNSFKFEKTNNKQVEKLLNDLSSTSGPGASGISSKVLKSAASVFTPIITNLFNDCIEQAVLPDEWKMAIVTPIYKNKGSNEDMNNYRGISVISPIAKIFEKILALQIITYLNNHKILLKRHHGFRSEHSCETALHELLSDMNMIRSQREIGIFLFIDFRKAFDLVDPDLLIFKLKLYGFQESALNLIKSYFTNRSQKVKFGGFMSTLRLILLSVPQGSIIGPLFFLIFINDMAFFMKNMNCDLFADDTTLYKSGDDLNELIGTFKRNVALLQDWCLFNRLDINWSKTFATFVTNKRIKLPSKIDIDQKCIKVVSTFELLGISIDNKLNFSQYVGEMRKTINMKLHSIKRLFYLSAPVKIQFFKTFILPCFDYCSTLAIYYSKRIIQKIANCYKNYYFL
jgi:hypothetical protein